MSDTNLQKELQLLDQLTTGIAITVGGIYQYVNAAMLRVYGLARPGDMLGRHVTEFVEPEHHPILLDRLRQVETGTYTSAPREYTVRRSDGEIRVVEAFSIPRVVDGNSGALTVLMDVTERVQRWRDLVDRDSRWRYALESSQDGLWDHRYDTGETYYSPQYCEMLGYTQAEFGEEFGSWFGRIHPDDIAAVTEAVRAHEMGEAFYDQEFRIQAKDGSYRWISARGQIIRRAEDGKPIRSVGTHRDITELKESQARIAELNAELQARARQLEDANLELESFVSAVSHDLRSPLRSISAFAAALRQDASDRLTEDSREDLGRIEAAAARMARTLESLLQLSRVGRSSISVRTIDISALAEEFLAEFKRLEPGREVDVEIEPGVSAWGDPTLVRLILQNLLGNAWKFTRKTQDPRIRVAHGPEPGSFVVEDNGAGFEPTVADTLFEPFRRFHSDAEFKGTGLGLAIVSRIVRRHGGWVRAEGCPGERAAFTVWLPEPGQS